MDVGAGGADPESLGQKTVERSNVYGFLAAIYGAEPTADLLGQIKDPPFLQALSAAGVALDEDFLSLPEEQLLSHLSLEYTRLFIGPGKHISPHESVHTPGDGESLWGKSTAAVKQLIESVGIEFRPDYHGLPDHISVELEFMQKVTKAEAEAWQRGDYAGAAKWLRLEQEFVDSHLAIWIPAFCENVVGQTELSFYSEMAKLTREFIETEKEQIERLIHKHQVH
jgi:TorA maturation chaperone TorD